MTKSVKTAGQSKETAPADALAETSKSKCTELAEGELEKVTGGLGGSHGDDTPTARRGYFGL
jgi:hypothetical protein